MKAIGKYIFAVAALMLSFSCERRPLEDPGYSTDINIAVDIKAICNVTCDVYNDKIPIPPMEMEVMHAMFYHPTEDKLITEAFVSEHGINEDGEAFVGGSVSIIPGKYRILIYSFGTESTLISEYDSFDLASAYTDPLSDFALQKLSLKGPDEDQPILYQPDHLLVARSYEENIPYHAGVYTIHAQASSVVESYYLQVKVDGLEYVSSAQAVLTGMAPRTKLASVERDVDNPSALYVPLIKSTDKGADVICNVFNTFGRIPDSINDLSVTFDLMTVDGRMESRTFNISDLFLTEDCINHHWLLLEETIVVPPPPPDWKPGGGFDPAVVEWEEEHRDMIL